MPNEQEGKKRPELFGYVWGCVGEGAGGRWPHEIANSQSFLATKIVHSYDSV